MKHQKEPPTSPGLPDKPCAAEDQGKKIDRPGFDLGGASDDTHAGTGLGLGEDASETAGDRRLPGRRLHNKQTIPRWSGPTFDSESAPVKTPSGSADRKT